jgi:hypothetical protein
MRIAKPSELIAPGADNAQASSARSEVVPTARMRPPDSFCLPDRIQRYPEEYGNVSLMHAVIGDIFNPHRLKRAELRHARSRKCNGDAHRPSIGPSCSISKCNPAVGAATAPVHFLRKQSDNALRPCRGRRDD